jgi:iron complex transport system ATP-binding protein
MSIVSIHQLEVHRGKTRILQDIDWHVGADENWVILGANGSGKTTLLSCITGYVTPSAGTIQVLGKQYGKSDWRELRKEVGLVSSSVRQMIEDDQLGIEIVASGRRAEINSWHPVKGAEREEAVQLLAQVECERLADRPWGYLSQGERQRILIGRALMARCKILILDEPCAGLDPVARERFLDFLSRLAGSEGTPNLVLVTHHVEEILPCFSVALLLRDGRILARGPVRRVVITKLMTEAFGASLTVRRRGGRLTMALANSSGQGRSSKNTGDASIRGVR